MNARIRPQPEREMLIEDLELRIGEGVAYMSVVARARFYDDGQPYVFEVIDKANGESLSLGSAFNALIEMQLEERYAPRELEEV